MAPLDLGIGVALTSLGIPNNWLLGTAPFLEFDLDCQYFTRRGVPYADFASWWTAVGGTYTRSGNKRYVGSNQLLTSAGANVWPDEYDIRTGKLNGKSVWPAVTARGVNRRDLTNASWTKTNGTAALDQTGIDGGSNSASSFTATSANATCLQAVSDATSRTRTIAVFLKRLTGTGAVSLTVDGGTTYTDVTTQVVSGAWNEVLASQITVSNPTFGIKLATSGDAVAWDVGRVVDGSTSGPPLFDGETNSADDAQIPNSALGDINMSEGVVAIYTQAQNVSLASSITGAFVSLYNSTSEILAEINKSSNGTTGAHYYVGNVDQGPTTPGGGAGSISQYAERKPAWLAARYKVGSGALSIDSFTGTTLSLAALSSAAPALRLGNGRGGPFGGFILGARVYRKGLTGAGLANAAATFKPLAFRGDSIAGGTAASLHQLEWGFIVCNSLTPRRTYGDLGVGGSTSAQCLAAIQADTDRRDWTHLVYTGQNDAVTAAETIANLQAIDAAIGHGRVIFCTLIVHSVDNAAQITRKNTINAAIAALWPTRYIDIKAAIDNNGGVAALISPDNIHPNDAGEAVMAAAAIPVVQANGW
jgi:lysophospholipase L1-like esterase